MGAQLVACFEEARCIGGMVARVKLAMLTRMGSAQAETYPDQPEHLQRFRDALSTIRQEYVDRPVAPGKAHPRLLRAYVELMDERAALLADPSTGFGRVTEVTAQALEVERTSIWFLDERRTLMRCVDQYSQTDFLHLSGNELRAKDHPAYFKALEGERSIAAHDAHADTRTTSFSASFLKPQGITSMLDVPIWANGRMKGVLRNEHTGPRRIWTAVEEEFAYRMGSVAALLAEMATH